MKKYLTILIFFWTGIIYGQDSLTVDNCKGFKINYSLTKYYGRYIRTYEMGGQKLSKEQLVGRLNIFPESANEYRLMKKSKKAAMISLAVGLPLIIAGDIYGHNQNLSTGALIGGSIVLMYTIQVPGFQAIRHHKRALNIYNKNICGQ